MENSFNEKKLNGSSQSETPSSNHLHYKSSRNDPPPNILVGTMPVLTSVSPETIIERPTLLITNLRPPLPGAASHGRAEPGFTPIRAELMNDNSHKHYQPKSPGHHQSCHNSEELSNMPLSLTFFPPKRSKLLKEAPTFVRSSGDHPLAPTLLPSQAPSPLQMEVKMMERTKTIVAL